MTQAIKDECTRVFMRVLTDMGAGHEAAGAIADDLMAAFLKHYAGERLYVGKRIIPESEIKADFNGRNHYALSVKYRVSKSTIYNIVGRK